MGRLRPKSFSVAFAAAAANGLPADAHRQSVILFPALVESYSIAFGEDAVINSGITVRPGMTPVRINHEYIGDAIGLPVSIVGTGAASAPILTVSDG